VEKLTCWGCTTRYTLLTRNKQTRQSLKAIDKTNDKLSEKILKTDKINLKIKSISLRCQDKN